MDTTSQLILRPVTYKLTPSLQLPAGRSPTPHIPFLHPLMPQVPLPGWLHVLSPHPCSLSVWLLCAHTWAHLGVRDASVRARVLALRGCGQGQAQSPGRGSWSADSKPSPSTLSPPPRAAHDSLSGRDRSGLPPACLSRAGLDWVPQNHSSVLASAPAPGPGLAGNQPLQVQIRRGHPGAGRADPPAWCPWDDTQGQAEAGGRWADPPNSRSTHLQPPRPARGRCCCPETPRLWQPLRQPQRREAAPALSACEPAPLHFPRATPSAPCPGPHPPSCSLIPPNPSWPLSSPNSHTPHPTSSLVCPSPPTPPPLST